MNITAPVSRVAEIPLLAAAGAAELYCGVVPPEWVAKFGTSGVNRRLFGNLPDLESLAAAVADAHRAGCRLSLVMNAQHYAAHYLGALGELARRFADMGGDALIVGDLGLVAHLADLGLGVSLHVSSVASCRNAESVRLAGELGARRVILPRDVSVAEIRRMAEQAGGIEIEAFILNDGCVFEEGVCHTIHLPQKLGGPICLDAYDTEYRRCDGHPLSEEESEALARNEARYREWVWYRMGCGFSVTPAGLPYGPCGLCAIPELRAAGVRAIKIAGREGATERKLRSVEMVKGILDLDAAGMAAGEVQAAARGLRKEPQHCDKGHMCYYPGQARG